MNKSGYKSLATDARQYDLGELDWKTQTIESPSRKFFYSCLENNLGDLNGKRVIDIGSGTGYLTKLYKERNASEIFGVEPSHSNTQLSQRLNPEMKVTGDSFESFQPNSQFDVAVSVMVFEHIADPTAAFRKIQNMLEPSGLFYLVVGDKAYSGTPRWGYDLKVQILNDGEIATMTRRLSSGVMYDIYRPIENYIRYAEAGGLKIKEHLPLLPTEDLLRERPKYLDFKNAPIAHLLVFIKNV